MHEHWQLQDAKQRFSELIRSVETEGPQFVTKHGQEVAVVIDITEYRRLRGGGNDFKEFLRAAPDVELDIERSTAPSRDVDFSEDE